MALTQVSPALLNAEAQAQGFRNRIINGDMRIDQRNAGASVTPTDGQYTVDRWQAKLSQASKYSVQQSTTAPSGFSNSVVVTSLSAYSIGSSDAFSFRQAIEGLNFSDLGWGTANAKTITLSFWVRSSLIGTFGGSFFNSAANRSYPFTYSISVADTWEQKSVTVVGDTSGTWLTTNGVGVYVVFGLGVGSTLSGTAGSWSGNLYISATGATSVVGTNGATFYITGVQLEVGSVATEFERRPYGTELQLCQRYYEIGGYGATAIANDSTQFWSLHTFKVTKRALPTASLLVTSNIRYRKYGIADRDNASASLEGSYMSVEGCNLRVNGWSGLTANELAAVNYTTSSNEGNLFAFSAEL
jgi:hypothetical protein